MSPPGCPHSPPPQSTGRSYHPIFWAPIALYLYFYTAFRFLCHTGQSLLYMSHLLPKKAICRQRSVIGEYPAITGSFTKVFELCLLKPWASLYAGVHVKPEWDLCMGTLWLTAAQLTQCRWVTEEPLGGPLFNSYVGQLFRERHWRKWSTPVAASLLSSLILKNKINSH